MDHMKYIIVEENGINAPVLFSEVVSHQDIGENQKVISAGFCQIGIVDEKFHVSCYGKSDSLKIGSNPKVDASIIRYEFARMAGEFYCPPTKHKEIT